MAYSSGTDIDVDECNSVPWRTCTCGFSDLTGIGAVSSALGRLFADALASNSFSSSRIAAALALSSSGDGGIGSADAWCRDIGSKPGRVGDAGTVTTKELERVSHSADQANRATFMAVAQWLGGE